MTMSLLKSILKKMYHDYAIVFPGLDPMEAQRASVVLMKSNVPKIPSDYVQFLSMTDGLSWNGLTLFSLNDHEREQGAFVHPGIMQQFGMYVSNPLLEKKLVLGMAPEELIVFYPAQNEYQILDRYTYGVIIKLPRFYDVLYFYAGCLMETAE